MWKNKNFRLTVLLVLLILITSWVLLRDENKGSFQSNPVMFQVEDTLAIQSFSFVSSGEEIRVELQNGTWRLESGKSIDDYYRRLLFAVVSSAEAIRPVSLRKQEEITQMLDKTGIQFHLQLNNGDELNYTVGGNTTQTETYFRDPETGNTYLMGIPGYNSYLAGIYTLSPQEWEDKTLINSNWSSIQRLSVAYNGNEDSSFEIVYRNGFLSIPQVQVVDTAKMMDYVALYRPLKANYYFEEGEYPEFDSIATGTPVMTITLEELDSAKNKTLRFYPPIGSGGVRIARDRSGRLIGFDSRNVQLLSMERSYFKAE